MRLSIVLWSTVSGAILGLFIDATLIGVALLFSAVVPGIAARLNQRWLTTSAIIGLIAILIAMCVLGYLEGQLKAS